MRRSGAHLLTERKQQRAAVPDPNSNFNPVVETPYPPPTPPPMSPIITPPSQPTEALWSERPSPPAHLLRIPSPGIGVLRGHVPLPPRSTRVHLLERRRGDPADVVPGLRPPEAPVPRDGFFRETEGARDGGGQWGRRTDALPSSKGWLLFPPPLPSRPPPHWTSRGVHGPRREPCPEDRQPVI